MRSIVKYAAFTAGLVIIFKLTIYISGNAVTKLGSYSNLLSLIIIFPMVFIALKNMRDKQLGGYIRTGTAMKGGLGFAAVLSAILALYTYINFAFIDHETLPFILNEADKMAIEQKMNAKQIDEMRNTWTEFYAPFKQATLALLQTMIAASLIAFICSTFVVRNPPSEMN